MEYSRIEPGASRWQRLILPLNHRCLSWEIKFSAIAPNFAQKRSVILRFVVLIYRRFWKLNSMYRARNGDYKGRREWRGGEKDCRNLRGLEEQFIEKSGGVESGYLQLLGRRDDTTVSPRYGDKTTLSAQSRHLKRLHVVGLGILCVLRLWTYILHSLSTQLVGPVSHLHPTVYQTSCIEFRTGSVHLDYLFLLLRVLCICGAGCMLSTIYSQCLELDVLFIQ